MEAIGNFFHHQALICMQVGFHALAQDLGGLSQKEVNADGDDQCRDHRL
jgi:hypothetical protein